MSTRRHTLLAAALTFRTKFVVGTAIAASALLGASPASAAPCVADSIFTYATPGFSCNVGPMTFENIVFDVEGTVNNGFIEFIDGPVVPFTSDNEFGLTWTYS